MTARFASIFDLNDPTNRDRVAMLREGGAHDRRPSAARRRTEHGGAALPAVSGAGRGRDRINPHLHNVPVQIAAERGLPALAVWLWFVAVAAASIWPGLFRPASSGCSPRPRSPRWSSMLAAGMFEYNFGDSEFLMLFLLLVTLPFAAARHAAT